MNCPILKYQGSKKLTKNFWCIILTTTLSIFVFSVVLPATAAELEHTYDSLNRLIKTVSVEGSQITTIEYNYDDAGNLTNVNTTVQGGADLVDIADQFALIGCVDCIADVDGDGDVDGLDLFEFLHQ